MAERLILERHAPTAVVVNDPGDSFDNSGRTGRFLEPAAGKACWNVVALARVGLRHQLPGVFHRALREKGPLVLEGLHQGTDDAATEVTVTLECVDEPGPLQGPVPILFVRRFAPRATDLIKLIPGDVERPVAGLDFHLEYPAFAGEPRGVPKTPVGREKSEAAGDGRRFAVRILVCRTVDDRIDGVVVTFSAGSPPAKAGTAAVRPPARCPRNHRT